MFPSILVLALAASPLVAAHGKIAVVTGDLGGNGTGLGITGGVVPGPGPNYLTEVDTTIFWSKNIKTDDDLGYTDEAGNNKLTDVVHSMALSGSTLPQVSAGGSVSGTFRTFPFSIPPICVLTIHTDVVTSDGAGPLQALIDSSGTGKWSTSSAATVTTQVPGNAGNVAKRNVFSRALVKMGLMARATNVNKDYVSITLPRVSERN